MTTPLPARQHRLAAAAAPRRGRAVAGEVRMQVSRDMAGVVDQRQVMSQSSAGVGASGASGGEDLV
eukprot:12284209-Prorocentrum_lima.AAC.1